jgi:hypothetical protein
MSTSDNCATIPLHGPIHEPVDKTMIERIRRAESQPLTSAIVDLPDESGDCSNYVEIRTPQTDRYSMFDVRMDDGCLPIAKASRQVATSISHEEKVQNMDKTRKSLEELSLGLSGNPCEIVNPFCKNYINMIDGYLATWKRFIAVGADSRATIEAAKHAIYYIMKTTDLRLMFVKLPNGSNQLITPLGPMILADGKMKYEYIPISDELSYTLRLDDDGLPHKVDPDSKPHIKES